MGKYFLEYCAKFRFRVYQMYNLIIPCSLSHIIVSNYSCIGVSPGYIRVLATEFYTGLWHRIS